MSKRFDIEKAHLKQKLARLGSTVEENTAHAIQALIERDNTPVTAILKQDEVINEIEVDIEEDCLKILALHQPVAADLRFIITTLKSTNNLERIGDLATNIARHARDANERNPSRMIELTSMSTAVLSMVKQALDCLIDMDAAKAVEICKMDSAVDRLKDEKRQEICRLFQETPQDGDALLHMLSVVYSLERMGDLATNIAKDVVYLIKGDVIRHKKF